MIVSYKIRTTVLCSTPIPLPEIDEDKVCEFKNNLMETYNCIVKQYASKGREVTGAIFFIGRERIAVGSCCGRYRGVMDYYPSKMGDTSEDKINKIIDVLTSGDYTEKGCIKEIKKIVGI